MADFSRQRGLRAVAVHTGERSAPRASSLQALADGELDIAFTVAMFNEGVDVPAIDTVVMLRPTESPVIWYQQFGRGLRKAAGKAHLTVIDYIGNHRVFLTKVRALLRLGEGERALAAALEEAQRGNLVLPPGCEVTYDLEAIDILQRLVRKTGRDDDLEAFYLDFRERHGQRPTALEAFHAGFNPRRSGRGGWIAFVASRRDLTPGQQAAFERHGAFLNELETSSMTRSYNMLLLRAMLDEGALPGSLDVDRLTESFARAALRNPLYRKDISVDPADRPALRDLLVKNPIPAWTGAAEGRLFAWDGHRFATAFPVPSETKAGIAELAGEIVEWRLAEYLARRLKARLGALPDPLADSSST